MRGGSAGIERRVSGGTVSTRQSRTGVPTDRKQQASPGTASLIQMWCSQRARLFRIDGKVEIDDEPASMDGAFSLPDTPACVARQRFFLPNLSQDWRFFARKSRADRARRPAGWPGCSPSPNYQSALSLLSINAVAKQPSTQGLFPPLTSPVIGRWLN